MAYETLIVEIEDYVALIRLNRPDALNSLTFAMYAELIEQMEAVRYDHDVRVVLLTGAGVAFCAGDDVKELKSLSPVPTAVGQTFESEYSAGPEVQLLNFTEYQRKCKATKLVPATDYHKDLPGKVLELDCENFRDGALHYRSKWAVIQQFGIAVMTEAVGTGSKNTYKIVEVSAQR